MNTKIEKMEKIIYFVRHGETVANVSGETQGPEDPLNENGKQQAQIVAKRAQNIDFQKIISSDYLRARITAETIQSKTAKPLELSEHFRELRRPSEFWGRVVKDDQEVLDGYKQMQQHFFDENWHYSDEENFFDLKKRGEEALEYLLHQEEEKILVVTHGNFLRCLLGLMLRGDDYSPQDYLDIETTFAVHNTGITLVKYEYHWRRETNTWMISVWNDDSHLG